MCLEKCAVIPEAKDLRMNPRGTVPLFKRIPLFFSTLLSLVPSLFHFLFRNFFLVFSFLTISYSPVGRLRVLPFSFLFLGLPSCVLSGSGGRHERVRQRQLPVSRERRGRRKSDQRRTNGKPADGGGKRNSLAV